MKFYPAAWRKDAPDAEIVGAVRDTLRMMHKMRWFWLVSAVLMLCIAGKFCDLFLSHVRAFPEDKQMQYYGFFTGLVFGFIFCFTMAQAGLFLFHWLDWKLGHRTERLLIKYFDLVQQKKTSNDMAEPTRATEGARGSP